MLILTRKPNECIRIGDDITIRVFGVRGNQVTIGFDAPLGVRIYREELLKRIQEEKRTRGGLDANRRKTS